MRATDDAALLRSDDDCFAVRLAAAYTRRFGNDALPLGEVRLARAVRAGAPMKIDLYTAVVFVLRDDQGIFGRSRRRRPILPGGRAG